MKCALAIMLAAMPIFAQSFALPPSIDPSKCPIGLEVEQNGSLVASSGPADDVGQRFSKRFDFKMTNFLPHEIVRTEIAAHAFAKNGESLVFPLQHLTSGRRLLSPSM